MVFGGTDGGGEEGGEMKGSFQFNDVSNKDELRLVFSEVGVTKIGLLEAGEVWWKCCLLRLGNEGEEEADGTTPA